MQQKEFHDKRVYKYQFDDPEINDILDKLSKSMVIEKESYQKSVKQTKILVAVAAGLLITLFEYLLLRGVWTQSMPLKIAMILLPVFAIFLGYQASKLYLLVTGEERNMFYKAYHWATENRFYYVYEGCIEKILRKEKYWSYIVAGNYLWRVRNSAYYLEDMIEKDVKLVLIGSFSDDMMYECLYVTT